MVGTGLPAESDLFPIYYANAKNLWQGAGLNVKVQGLTPAAEVAATVAGSLDISFGSAGLLTAAVDTGKLTIIGTYAEVGITLYARPDSGLKPIKSLQDLAELKGLRFAGTSRGSLVDVATRGLLAKAGLTPDKDVNFVYLGTGSSALAVQHHEADIANVTSTTRPVAEKAGLVSLGSMNTLTDPPGQGLHAFVAVNTNFLKAHPQAVAAFGRVYQQALTAGKADETYTASLIADAAQLSDDAALKALQDQAPTCQLLPLPPAELQFDLSNLAGSDPAAKKVSASTVVNDTALFSSLASAVAP